MKDGLYEFRISPYIVEFYRLKKMECDSYRVPLDKLWVNNQNKIISSAIHKQRKK